MNLRGKRVLITGASRGIGESLAYTFAGAGATVALVARSKDAILALASELRGTAHPADLSDPTQVANLVSQVEVEAGPIDVLVNNAGSGVPGSFVDPSHDDLREVTQINYLAPAELCRQAIPRMLERGGGHIVNVSSLAAIAVFPGLVTYSASKAAVDPGLELGAVRAAEADVVEAGAELAEAVALHRPVVLVDAEQRAIVERPHQMPESGVGVLVEHRVGAEQRSIPRPACVDITHRDRDVIQCGHTTRFPRRARARMSHKYIR
jgi:short chain dehydrogenase